MYKNLFSVSLALFALTGSALADPSKCYYCDGTSTLCDDPVDTSKLDICTVSTDNLFEISAFKNFNVTLKSESLTPVSAKSGNTCAKLVLTQGNAKSTVRLCAYKTLDGKDTCTYLKDNVDVGDAKLVCKTCDKDLCNSASTAAISLLSLVGLFFVLLTLK